MSKSKAPTAIHLVEEVAPDEVINADPEAVYNATPPTAARYRAEGRLPLGPQDDPQGERDAAFWDRNFLDDMDMFDAREGTRLGTDDVERLRAEGHTVIIYTRAQQREDAAAARQARKDAQTAEKERRALRRRAIEEFWARVERLAGGAEKTGYGPYFTRETIEDAGLEVVARLAPDEDQLRETLHTDHEAAEKVAYRVPEGILTVETSSRRVKLWTDRETADKFRAAVPDPQYHPLTTESHIECMESPGVFEDQRRMHLLHIPADQRLAALRAALDRAPDGEERLRGELTAMLGEHDA